MTKYLVALGCILLLFQVAAAEAPLMQVPPAPELSAAQAVKLADAYVATSLPEDSSLYCQSAQLRDGGMRPLRAYRHWDLVYRQAGARRHVDPESGKETFGDLHVYVTMGGEVSREE